MTRDRMTKQEQFLYIVQTAILANGINLTSDPDSTDKYRHDYSAAGVLGMMHDVIWASERIPNDMTAAEAAHESCGFMLSNLRNSGETPAQLPMWFARRYGLRCLSP
jgi:hypothetical protein